MTEIRTGAGAGILVIDDDEELVEALTVLFEDAGYRIRHAFDGRAAMILARAEPPDLALLDVRLGVESGLALLPALKALRPDMVVVVFTAMATKEVMGEALRRGADAFATKAIDPPHLLEIVASGLHGTG